MSCRTPDIQPWWPEGYSPDKPYLLPTGETYQHYKCVNCDRSVYTCPRCHMLRCESWLWFTMVGHIPLGCKVCMPNGVEQSYTMGAGGMYTGELRWYPRGAT